MLITWTTYKGVLKKPAKRIARAVASPSNYISTKVKQGNKACLQNLTQKKKIIVYTDIKKTNSDSVVKKDV